MNSIPDTVQYFSAGILVLGLVITCYIGSLLIRLRRLKRELGLLEKIVQDCRTN